MVEALKRGVGVGVSGALARKRRKPEELEAPQVSQVMEPERLDPKAIRKPKAVDRYTLNPNKLDNLAAKTVQMMTPFAKSKRSKSGSYLTKSDAVDSAIPEDHPLKGYSHALREGYAQALQDPQLKDVPVDELLTEVPKFIAKEGKYAQEGVPSLTEKIHEYKFKKDSAAGNLFGLFGGDDSIRALPGFEEYKEMKRKAADEAPDYTDFKTELGATAVGHVAVSAIAKRTAIRAVIGMGLRAATVAALVPGPGWAASGVVLGATALMMIPEAYLMAKASNAIERSDFGITASGWGKLAANMGVGMGLGSTGYKLAAKGAGKLIGKEATEKLATGAKAFDAAQKDVRTARKELRVAKSGVKKGTTDKEAVQTAEQNLADRLNALTGVKKATSTKAATGVKGAKAAKAAEAKAAKVATKVAATEEALKPLTIKTAAVEAAGVELMQDPVGTKILQYMKLNKAQSIATAKYEATTKAFTKEDAIEIIKPKLAKTPGASIPAWENYGKIATDTEMENLFKTMAEPDGMKMATARVNTKQLQVSKMYADAEIKWKARAPKPDDPQGSLDGEKVFTSTKVREAHEAEELTNLTVKSQASDGTVSDIPYSKFAKEAIETDKALLDFGGKTPKISSGAKAAPKYKRPHPKSRDPLATPTPEMQAARKAARAEHIAVSGYKEPKPLPGLAGNTEMRIQQLRKRGYEVPEDIANAMRTGTKSKPKHIPTPQNTISKHVDEYVKKHNVSEKVARKKLGFKPMQPQKPISVKSQAGIKQEARNAIETPKITSKQAAKAVMDDAADEASAGTLKTLPSTNKTYSTVKTTNKFAKTAIDGKPEDIVKAWGGGKNLKKITKKNLQDIYRGVRKGLPEKNQLPAQGTKADLIRNIEDGITTLKGGAPKLETPTNVLPSTQGVKAPKVPKVTSHQAKIDEHYNAYKVKVTAEPDTPHQKLFNPPDAEYAETVKNFAKAGMKYLDENKTGTDALKAIRMVSGMSEEAGKDVLAQLHDAGKITLKEGSPSVDAIEINGKYYEDVVIREESIFDLQQRTNEDVYAATKAIFDELAAKSIIKKGDKGAGWHCSVPDDAIQGEAKAVLSRLSKAGIDGAEGFEKIIRPLGATIPVSSLLDDIVGTVKDAATTVGRSIKQGAENVKRATNIASEAIPAVSKEVSDELISGIQAHAIKVKAALKIGGTHTKTPEIDMKKAMKKYTDFARANNYVHRPVSEGAKKIDVPQMEVMDLARENILEHGGLPKVVNNVKGFWLGLHKIMSPDGLAATLYKEGTSPTHQIAQGSAAIALNTQNGRTVVKNILKDVTAADGRNVTDTIGVEMADLAKRHTKEVRPLEVVEQMIKHKTKVAKDLVKAMGHKPTLEQKRASLKLDREIKQLDKKLKKLTKGADKWKADYDVKAKGLAKKYATTRISLATEDTDDFLHNPWLKGMLNDEELEAVVHLKSLNKDYGERVKMAGTWVNRKGEVKGGGTELIKERPYMHHAWHPNWNRKDLEKALEAAGFDTSAGIKPFSKFFRRSRHSQQLVPDANYNMNKYVGDTEKRLIWDKFWQNGNPNGWARHANNPHLRKSEVYATFWDNLKKAAAPEQFSKTNIWANRYSGLEVFRLLSVSPSVPFKHLFKNVGTHATVGPENAIPHIPSAMKGAARIHIAPVIKKLADKYGIKFKVTPKDSDDMFYSWTHQGSFHGTVSDLGFERIADMNKLGRAFDKGLAKVNHYLAFPVRAIESFDRFHAMQVSLDMAIKRGMTKKQGMYAVYDTILKNSFLGGPLNPPWMKDPKFRALALFQNTPFRIAQRRANVLMRSGKSIGKSIKVLKHWDNEEALAKMAKIDEFVKDGQARFKAGMLLDALKSEKDVFGTPIIKQALREAIIAGGLIGTVGYVANTDLKEHVNHLPFVGTNRSGDITVRTNPALNAMIETKNDDGDEFFVSKFLNHYGGRSKGLPIIINKAMRISDKDIPARYLNEDGDENTAALIRYFFGAPAQGRH